MKKELGWPVLLFGGAGVWLVGKLFSESFLGSALAVIGIIMFLLGVVAAVRAYRKPKE